MMFVAGRVLQETLSGLSALSVSEGRSIGTKHVMNQAVAWS